MSRHWPWLLLIPAALFVLVRGLSPGRPIELEKQELLKRHQELLRAVRQGDLDAWLALETEDFVECSAGEISEPSIPERRAQRSLWLGSLTLTRYEDAFDPIVEVSNDGSLAWLITRVHIAGTKKGPDGVESEIDRTEPWVELYRKVEGEWKLGGRQRGRCQSSASP